jgi:hypothetical protein
MPRRSSKKGKRLPDPNELAFGIVQAITGEPPAEKPVESPGDGKNPEALAFGVRHYCSPKYAACWA